ncbi:MAG: hypothetical protein EA416_17320, partial [Trueperaceae bacterium]
FGAVTVATGSLWPALIAHVAVNLHGFSLGGRGRGRGPRDARRPGVAGGGGLRPGDGVNPGTPGSERPPGATPPAP